MKLVKITSNKFVQKLFQKSIPTESIDQEASSVNNSTIVEPVEREEQHVDLEAQIRGDEEQPCTNDGEFKFESSQGS